MTVERVKEVRARRGRAGGGGARRRRSTCLDLGDYPLDRRQGRADRDRRRRSASSRPTSLLTHTDRDPFNPDHAEAFFAVEKARALAAGAGTASAFGGPIDAARAPALRAAPARALQLHADDVRRHHAGDRAEARGDGGDAGAGAPARVLRRSCAEQRGNHARRSSGNNAIQFAEAFQRVTPQVVERAVTAVFAELAELGSATVHEAGGRCAGRRRRPGAGRSPARAPPARRAPCAAARATT